VRQGGVDGADGVGEDAAVVVVGRVEDAAGHEAGGLGVLPADGVRGVAGRAVGALAASVHDEGREPGGRGGEPVVREAAAAAVADVVDDGGQRRRGPRRDDEPAGDAVPAPAGVAHVVHVDEVQGGVVRGELRVEREVRRLGQGAGPELVEVGLLVALGAVLAQFRERLVEQRHGRRPPRASLRGRMLWSDQLSAL
jgi:hypothetical protein